MKSRSKAPSRTKEPLTRSMLEGWKTPAPGLAGGLSRPGFRVSDQSLSIFSLAMGTVSVTRSTKDHGEELTIGDVVDGTSRRLYLGKWVIDWTPPTAEQLFLLYVGCQSIMDPSRPLRAAEGDDD
jgi:hypothetical protein